MQIEPLLKMNSISIQNTSKCNLKCSVCLHSVLWEGRHYDMPMSIWLKIILNLRRHNHHPSIVLDIMGEPLLDDTLKDKLSVARANLDSHISIVTNGTMLTSDMTNMLISQNVHVAVSILGGSPSEYERVTGLSFNFLLRRIAKCMDMGLDISATITALDDPSLTEMKLSMLGVPYEVHRPYLMTRALGTITQPNIRRSGCPFVFQNAYVNVDGDIFMCCSDWSFRSVIGNISDGLVEVWNNNKIKEIRRHMLVGKFPVYCTDSDTFCMMD